MTEAGDIGRKFLWRLLIALPFIAGVFFFLLLALNRGMALLAIPGLALLLIAVLILREPLADVFAAWFVSAIYPTDYFNKAPPAYSIPEALVKRSHYHEALAAYEKIAAEHPEEVQPYVSMIEVALIHLNDRKLASLIYYKGMDTLTKEEDRVVLVRLYKAVHSRIEPKPPWERERTIKLLNDKKRPEAG